jgi:hypothetical protein
MRSSKLVPALAAATLLALAPAGAMAKPAGQVHSGAAVGGSCRPTIELLPGQVITAGEKVTVTGKLCATTGAASSAVTVYSRTVTRSHTQRGATVVSNASVSGENYTFESTPQFNTNFYVRQGNVRSAPKTVKVAPQVTITGQPAENTPLLTGVSGKGRARALNKYKFIGTVSPFEKGEIVALQRENSSANEEWLLIDRAMVDGTGKFTIEHVFHAPGDANLRVVAHPNFAGLEAPGASSVMSYVIDQPQNPQLEIHTEPFTPITAGQPVTIKGKVAGATTVALFGHTAGQKFAQIGLPAQVNAAGEYKFSQSPAQNTAYQVRDTVTRSAVAVVGVKPALTATPKATTVQAGEQVTFTGTITPAPTTATPQLVYLERQNASGIGFHVVEVVQVSSGNYTISHAFFAPGTAKLRVKVAGSPERQGVASAIEPITITPAPPGTLKAAPPGKLPRV